MTSPPELTDRPALARNRRRARALGPAVFLQEDVADEIQERLAEVNRPFTSPAIVTAFPEIWAGRMPGATIVADDDILTLRPAAHDLVIHALCLHWANDPVGQLIQSRRALTPDGLLLGATFGGRTLAELRAAVAGAEIALSGGLGPRVLPMGEIRDLGALLQRAGFALPVADSAPREVLYRSFADVVRDLRAMGEGNALADRSRRYPGRRFPALAGQFYADAFRAPDGRLRATFDVIFLTGWAPADSQPKPLRPGSAAARLADALKVPEQPLSRDGNR